MRSTCIRRSTSSDQCRATIERRAPTYFRHAPTGTPHAESGNGYSRLILPLWGNGRTEMSLGGVVSNRAPLEPES
jgi:hypothetical protein